MYLRAQPVGVCNLETDYCIIGTDWDMKDGKPKTGKFNGGGVTQCTRVGKNKKIRLVRVYLSPTCT